MWVEGVEDDVWVEMWRMVEEVEDCGGCVGGGCGWRVWEDVEDVGGWRMWGGMWVEDVEYVGSMSGRMWRMWVEDVEDVGRWVEDVEDVGG